MFSRSSESSCLFYFFVNRSFYPSLRKIRTDSKRQLLRTLSHPVNMIKL